MASDKAIRKLAQAFEEMYKYYHGWRFAWEHPGFFAYHQMGGDLTVSFTPDWNELGKVSIQISDVDGQVVDSQEVPYEHPARNGIPYEEAEAYSLFRIVRPYLEANKGW